MWDATANRDVACTGSLTILSSVIEPFLLLFYFILVPEDEADMVRNGFFNS